MALSNAILLSLKNPKVYQKYLEEDQDSLTAERRIEIATPDSQSANKASKRWEINGMVKLRQDV